MSDTAEYAQLQAAIFDFAMRIELLEEIIHGDSPRHLPLDFLLGLYVEAQRDRPLTEELSAHWARQFLLLDVRQLLALVKHTRDIHPWRPFLVLMDIAVSRSFRGAERAQRHLLLISQQLLIAQGLELLQPRDVMGHQLPMKAAITAISE
jgi:hypothetical protein